MPPVAWAILDELGPEEQRIVLSRCVRRRFKKGETLFHEGDPGSTLHLLDKGRVAVRVTTPLGDVATLTVLCHGDTFGEQALLQRNSLRTASVVALEATETLTMAADVFDELRDAQPSIDRILVAILAAQVRRLSTSLTEALYLPAEKRVLRRLVELGRVYRSADSGPNDPVNIAVTQEELASMAGTTRPTTNRVLQDAVANGCIALGRGRVEIIDGTRLAELSR